VPTVDLGLLAPDFRVQAEELLRRLRTEGHELKPFFGVRGLEEQARLWRQSRSAAQVQARVAKLEASGALRLAAILRHVGPQVGRWATNALPGDSWHQWGEAIDCFVVERGAAVWDARHPGYIRYASLAIELGLTSGRSFGDAVHVQLRSESAPHKFLPWPEIEIEMARRFPLALGSVTA